MNSERIQEIQKLTAYPESHSVQKALLLVWNECRLESNKYLEEQDIIIEAMKNCYNCKFDCEQKSCCIASGYKEWKIKPCESD